MGAMGANPPPGRGFQAQTCAEPPSPLERKKCLSPPNP